MPLNSCNPKTPNRIMIKLRKIATLDSSGMEFIKADTIFLILGIALIVLSGLMTLKILKTFRSKEDSC